MRRNIVLGLIIAIMLVAGCTSPVEEQVASSATKPQAQVTIIRSTPTPEIPTRIPTNTASLTKTLTLTPSYTPTIPTNTAILTPTDVDWDQMPKLSQLILSTDELAALQLYATYATSFTITDISAELVNDCQLDCVKTKYTYEDGSVIMMMIRTKSHEQAQLISANFRESVLDISILPYEYTDHPNIMKEEEFWMIMSHPDWEEQEYFFTDYAGIAYDDVVILMVHKQNFCFDDPEVGYTCGDDVGSIAADTYRIFSKQVDKLRAAGYAE